MPIRYVDCDSWTDFKKTLPETLFGNAPVRRGLYLFRGQRKSEWTLTSSYDRWFDNQAIPGHLRIETANDLERYFREELADLNNVRGYAQEPQSHQSNDDAAKKQRLVDLAMGQHHGLPTRLLDWSESFYVASFFAFIEAAVETPAVEISNDRVAIWALDSSSRIWNAELGVEIVTVPNQSNARLRNQEGHFTLSRTTFADLESYVNAAESRGNAIPDKPPLVRFSIPARDAELALGELDVMGIKPSRLYPDVEGCVVSAKLKSRLINIYSQIRSRAASGAKA